MSVIIAQTEMAGMARPTFGMVFLSPFQGFLGVFFRLVTGGLGHPAIAFRSFGPFLGDVGDMVNQL